MPELYRISNILPANDALLKNDIFLILLYATRIPPHLLVSIYGKIFTLSVKGATVNGELGHLLKLIRRKNIDTLFIKLTLPSFFTLEKLHNEICNCMLAYPRADVGIATCLTPIRDFCKTVYHTETKNVNLIFDLLSKLEEKNAINGCYHINLENYLSKNCLNLIKYEVSDVYEAIKKSSLIMA